MKTLLSWLVVTGLSATQPSIQPEVHSVRRIGDRVEIRSAGLSLTYMGPFQSAAAAEDRVHQYLFRIPFDPAPAAGAHTSLRPGIAGVFSNGVPLFNFFDDASYQGQNLWHFDPVPGAPIGEFVLGLLAESTRHSPIIGYALDGYPIYGPWAFAGNGVRRMRSSYRLRAISRRTTWPDGTALAPGQYGPDAGDEFPLGAFAEDYEYAPGAGDLDEFNGRFGVTPEYPAGTYAYFLSTDAAGKLAFPYLLGSRYFGRIEPDRLDAAVRDGDASEAPLLAPRKGAVTPSPSRVRLLFDAGVRYPEHVHERPMHLIIVNEDLSSFAHVHPQLVAGDRFAVEHEFPAGGRYRLYLEYTPPGAGTQTDTFDLDVSGDRRAALPAAPRLPVGFHHPALRAGEDVTLRFSMPVTDLQPYLGAWAHVVIIGGNPRSFIHAHPLEQSTSAGHSHTLPPGPSPAEIQVTTAFPHAGVYKLWIQVQRSGEVITTPFEVTVAPAQARSSGGGRVPPGAIVVQVDGSGFTPARIEAPAGVPVTIAFRRSGESNCASSVVFPDLKIRRDLPFGATTVVELPPLTGGELRFACGMGMYRGAIVAR